MRNHLFKMKYGIAFALSILMINTMAIPAVGESMNEMLGQFEKEFEAARPAPNSSVNADYKLEQTALGTLYTTRAINKLFDQNREMIEKYNEMLIKYEEMVSQNKEIIRLLSIIANKEVAPEKKEPESAPPLGGLLKE